VQSGLSHDYRPAFLAEREGFEPPIRLPVCRISSAVLSTTQPPLRGRTPSPVVVRGVLTKEGRRNKGIGAPAVLVAPPVRAYVEGRKTATRAATRTKSQGISMS